MAKANSTSTAKQPTRRRGDATIEKAKAILARRLQQPGTALSDPNAVRDWLMLNFADREREAFTVLWLNSQNQVVGTEELFRGTATQTAVYPREVVKSALQYNASSGIIAHNHPSGVAEPSPADKLLTRTLREALAVVDIKLVDHFIVAGLKAPVSFVERGLM